DWLEHGEPAFTPELDPVDHDDAWQPEDALFAALRHSDGHLLGVLSLDEPDDRMRPSPSDLAVLAGVAAHLAQTIESAEAGQVKDRLLDEITRQQRELRDQSEMLEQTVKMRTRELEEARIETLQRLAFAAEFRDDDTRQHTE